MMVSSVVSSQVGVVLAQKMSYRNTMLPFGVVFLLGTYLLTTITPIPAGLALVLVFIMNREGMDMGPQMEGAESF